MARSFDGVDDFLSAGNSTSLQAPSTEITLACWFKPTANAPSNGGRIHNKINATNVLSYGLVPVSDTPAGFRVRFFLQISGTLRSTGIGAALTQNLWYFIIGRWLSGEVLNHRVYNVDGSLVENVDSAAFSGTISYDTSDYRTMRNELTAYTAGVLAEELIYSKKLSLDEITSVMRGRVQIPKLELHRPLWGTASPEPDLSGNRNNGTVTGAVLADHAPVGPYVVPFSPRVV